MAPPSEIIDPNGLITSLTYDAQLRLTKITEPAGRWLKISYLSYISKVESFPTATATISTQSVTYSYTAFGSYTVLSGATYDNATSASYTYQASNMTMPQVATPTFSPVPGAYPNTDFPKPITISTTTTGASISFTTDGSIPTSSHGSIIASNTGTASVPAGATLKAIGFGTNMIDSAMKSGAYTALPAVATPTFNPVAGAYPASNYPKTITISTTTTGANMRYTTNGGLPSPTNGTLIAASSGTASVPANATLRAIAYKSGMSNSPVVNGVYWSLVRSRPLTWAILAMSIRR